MVGLIIFKTKNALPVLVFWLTAPQKFIALLLQLEDDALLFIDDALIISLIKQKENYSIYIFERVL